MVSVFMESVTEPMAFGFNYITNPLWTYFLALPVFISIHLDIWYYYFRKKYLKNVKDINAK